MIKNDQILKLLQQYIDTEMDYSLEFRKVYTGSLVTLVKRAYAAGHEAGYDEGLAAGLETEPAYEIVD